MGFIEPMLAGPLTDRIQIQPGTHVVELKFDGERLIVEVGDFRDERTILAWSRNGIERTLPLPMLNALAQLPTGVYDGELIAIDRQKSFHVKTKGERLRYMIFDVLALDGQPLINKTWQHRRHHLEEYAFRGRTFESIELTRYQSIRDRDEAIAFARTIIDGQREGVIIKDVRALYRPGKRGAEFIKLKNKQRALLTVVGFEPSKGTKVNRGPHAVTVLEDTNGNRVTVKTLNDAELAAFDAEAPPAGSDRAHPRIGYRLWIEYQERTPDGGYRHPMWDRWFDPEVDR